jgi:hypothetical protein
MARRASVIIINATRAGEGLAVELRNMPGEFPGKTWLLAGKDKSTGKLVSSDVENARRLLAHDEGHVSFADVSAGGVHFAEPRFPDWVRSVVVEAKQQMSRR